MSKNSISSFVLLVTYGLAGSCRAADVEGYGSNHGYEASVEQALDAAEYQESLHINGIRTQRKDSRGRILGRSPDKSLKGFLSRQKSSGFPPCYSKSPLQLCLGIFFSSNSRNSLTVSTARVSVHCKEEMRRT
jgi:hypothetical protein